MMPKIQALLLAFLMLVSTVSWTIEKHYCFGSLIDIAFFHEADTCGMDIGLVNATVDEEGNLCCEHEVITIPGQDNLKISYYDIDLGQQMFIGAYVAYHLYQFLPESQHLSPYVDYPPPILVKDIHILDQVFLI